MSRTARLDQAAIDEALAGLDAWSGDTSALTRTFTFESFRAAIDFIARAAPVIDDLDHHPEWTNVHDRVEVRLTSHDAGGVTSRDVRLAEALDGIALG